MQLHSAISVVVSTGKSIPERTITCCFSAISLSRAETLSRTGATDTFTSVTFSPNRSTTVLLTCSKDEKDVSEVMVGLPSFKPFHKVLDDLAWWSSLERAKALEYMRYLGPSEPWASCGLSLVGSVTTRFRKVGK